MDRPSSHTASRKQLFHHGSWRLFAVYCSILARYETLHCCTSVIKDAPKYLLSWGKVSLQADSSQMEFSCGQLSSHSSSFQVLKLALRVLPIGLYQSETSKCPIIFSTPLFQSCILTQHLVCLMIAKFFGEQCQNVVLIWVTQFCFTVQTLVYTVGSMLV